MNFSGKHFSPKIVISSIALGTALYWSLFGLYQNINHGMKKRKLIKHMNSTDLQDLTLDSFIQSQPIPSACSWMDQTSFDVFAAMIDALIPQYNEQQISLADLKNSIKEICPELWTSGALDFDTILKEKKHLQRGAIESSIHNIAALAFQECLLTEDKVKLHLFLRVLGTSMGSFLIVGFAVPFHELPLSQRVMAMKRLNQSNIIPIRAVYQTVKRITCNLFLSYCERGESNPSWEAIAYNPKETVSKPKKVELIDHSKSTFLLPQEHDDTITSTADVIIVGSGSGGGTIASELVKKGLNVIVLEKGSYFDHRDFSAWRETEAFSRAFERGGLLASADGNIIVLAGACVGGGSTVNWSASFRTPEHVLHEWTSIYNLPQFNKGGEFEKSLDAVHELFHVNSNFSHQTIEECCTDTKNLNEQNSFTVNRNNQLLWEGANKLGYTPEKIPRNVKDCVDCGHCCHGCPYGSKQSTVSNLMLPLLSNSKSISQPSSSASASSIGSLKVISNCYVDKILTRTIEKTKQIDSSSSSSYYSSEATGVLCTVSEYPDNDIGPTRMKPIRTRKIQINARIIVSSGGALHTPALLLRSGLTHPLIGKHLSLHPVVGAGGIFPDGGSTSLGSGVSMGVVVKTPLRQPTSHGVAVETPPLHPGLFGVILPWMGSGLAFKLGLLLWKKVGCFIGISRDRSTRGNCITIDKEGHPVVNYQVTSEDCVDLMDGLIAQLKMIYAAGACCVFPSSEVSTWFYAAPDKSGERNPDNGTDTEAAFGAYLREIRRVGIHPFKMNIFSAHQMSSCRMAARRSDGPVRPTGETWECRNLYCADASVFPTSLGINPMITVAAMAHYISKQVLADFHRSTRTNTSL